MKRTLTTICLVFICTSLSFAQEKTSKDLLYGDLSFGFETNAGNTGVLMGFGYQRNLSKKFIFQTDLHYYTTEIITNKWQYVKDFPKEEMYVRSAFLSAMLGYAVIGKTDKFNITIKGGLSLFHLNQKSRGYYQAMFYPEGNVVPVSDPGFILYSKYQISGTGQVVYGTGLVYPSTVRYTIVSKFDTGFNFGLDVNIPIRKRHFLTIEFLSYSSDIPLQYFFCPIPVISYKIKL